MVTHQYASWSGPTLVKVERERAGRPARGARGPRMARVLGSLALLAGTMVTLAGCGSAAAAGAGPGASCGTTRTAANVPIIIKVAKGTVDCGTAIRVENQYAAVIRSGQVRGNGGGAPVMVSGWTCQGYPTPEVLSTGNASLCRTSSAAIVAVLPVPAPSASITAG
jgi:hypothetical protein